ncbi:hypothetical protein [Sphingobium sp. YBL2]|uniref:hypothetical protein n=1 Tax=Sphingobium sp. (strain YBL2) TaxID=484429 RepID=UPI0005CC1A6B|nr:hypothetical protein [Sphingobium sp. YBL2]AJR23107.1 hypothetical protein TZ53_04320 [Sphingobium sp. YBL2]
MGVQIEAMDGGKLKLTGDVETVLDLPASAVTDGFSFAFSDGTLLKGHHDIGSGRCHFALAAEGTACVRIMREGRHDRARIDGQIEWMTLACGSRTLCPIHAKPQDDGRQLVLDIESKQAA